MKWLIWLILEARAEFKKIFPSFFGSNENKKIFFWNLLTFSSSISFYSVMEFLRSSIGCPLGHMYKLMILKLHTFYMHRLHMCFLIVGMLSIEVCTILGRRNVWGCAFIRYSRVCPHVPTKLFDICHTHWNHRWAQILSLFFEPQKGDLNNTTVMKKKYMTSDW